MSIGGSGTARIALIVALLAGYAVIGVHRQAVSLPDKPLPEFLMEDYNCYGRALSRWRAGESPYADHHVGTTAFLYPPQSLLLVGGLEWIHALPAKFAVYATLSLVALAGIVALALRASRTPPGDPRAWIAAVLALCFAPVGVSIYLGQVNVLVAFTLAAGFFLADRHPKLAGAAIAIGAAIKVTPMFLLVLFLRRRYVPVWISFLATSAALVVMTAVIFGIAPFFDFLSIAHMMNESFPVGFNGSLSLINVVYLTTLKFGWINQGDSHIVGQRIYSFILLTAVLGAAYLTRDGRRRDLLFALVTLALTVMPNVLWYHHFVFVLPALFALWLSPESTAELRAAALTALGIIQLDHILSPKVDKLTTTPICLSLMALILVVLVRARRQPVPAQIGAPMVAPLG